MNSSCITPVPMAAGGRVKGQQSVTTWIMELEGWRGWNVYLRKTAQRIPAWRKAADDVTSPPRDQTSRGSDAFLFSPPPHYHQQVFIRLNGQVTLNWQQTSVEVNLRRYCHHLHGQVTLNFKHMFIMANLRIRLHSYGHIVGKRMYILVVINVRVCF